MTTESIENVRNPISVQEIESIKLFYKRSSKLRILHCCNSASHLKDKVLYKLFQRRRKKKMKYFIATITSISIICKDVVREKNDRPTSLTSIDAEILKNVLFTSQILQYVKSVYIVTD